MRSYWIRMDPNSNVTSVFLKREETAQRGDHVRIKAEIEAATSQGMPRIPATTRSWERVMSQIVSLSLRSQADILNLDC